jgi:hypothetical protein
MSLTKTFVNDTARYRPINIKPEPNTIYLMARNAGPGVDHLYYLYTNSKGQQFTLSAFPKNDRSKVPGATIENIINGGGSWGSIVRKAGLFLPNTPDYFDSTKLAVYRSQTNDPNEVARDWQLLKREYDKIEGATLPYRLNGYNSNSAATTAERNWGNSTEITTTNQQPSRTDINTPGSQYDQIIEWYPNTQKSDLKNDQKPDLFNIQTESKATTKQSNNSSDNFKKALAKLEQIRNGYTSPPIAEQSSTGNDDLDKALAMLDQMNENEANFRPIAAQSSTGNDDLDQALAMLDQMNKEEAASSPPEKTVTTNRNRGREIGE